MELVPGDANVVDGVVSYPEIVSVALLTDVLTGRTVLVSLATCNTNAVVAGGKKNNFVIVKDSRGAKDRPISSGAVLAQREMENGRSPLV